MREIKVLRLNVQMTLQYPPFSNAEIRPPYDANRFSAETPGA